MSINILSNPIVNRISAGEVVESPFSIVKELLDNAIDANATKIVVEIKSGGIAEIIVRDNGSGIEKEDLPKAFLPHATSKIGNIEDLEAIKTLGFRGEALASISNVSETTIKTKTSDGEIGYQMSVFGTKFGEIVPIPFERGTTIIVANLFFNVPARKKFLKKPKIEENQITNLMARYILAHPNIFFRYVADGTLIYQTEGKSLFDAIQCVYNSETTQNIIEVNAKTEEIFLYGYVSKVGFSKPNTSSQTLIINNRYVIDETISKAIFKAFEEYLMPRQFPFFVFYLNLPETDIDVNIHPSKMNVKFAKPSEIYNFVYSSVRSAIFRELNHETTSEREIISSNDTLIKSDFSSLNEITIDPVFIEPTFEKDIILKQDAGVNMSIFNKMDANIFTGCKANINNATKDDSVIDTTQKNTPQNKQNSNYIEATKFVDFKIVGEIFNEFLVLEHDGYMVLLDFHAAHERLNYDKFSEIVQHRQIIIQNLLVPYSQTMSEIEVDKILSLKTELDKLGFDIEAIGNKKIIINSIPMQLKDINLKTFIDDILFDMKNLKPNLNYEIKHYLMQKACKNSVKTGMKLSESEIRDLLKNLDSKHPVLLCPHGRPVLTVVNRSQIEKWFKRIV